MKQEVLTPEYEKVMAEHPGLNQRQWWLVSDLTERLSQSESRRKELAEALRISHEALEWLYEGRTAMTLEEITEGTAKVRTALHNTRLVLSKEPK